MKLKGFICGPERSGTTVTSAYLSSHRDLYVINDPHVINLTVGVFGDKLNQAVQCSIGQYRDLYLKSLESIKAWYLRWAEFKDDPVDIWTLFQNTEAIIDQLSNKRMVDYFDILHKSLIPNNIRLSKPFYVVKVPALSHYSSLPSISKRLCSIILGIQCLMLRQLSSNYDRGWTFDQILKWYNSFFTSQILSYLDSSHCLISRYEDLIFQRDVSTRQILDHLGLKFSSNDQLPVSFRLIQIAKFSGKPG